MTDRLLCNGFPGRRAVLSGALATGVAASGAWPREAAAAEGAKVLKVRAYLDISNLDPAHRTGEPDIDVMLCIFTALADFKVGDV